jgi:uncharacterized protein YggE
MANASHQSKHKQQTSKKESQASPSPINGQAQVQEDRVHLSVDQAELAKQLLAASNEAQNQVQFFLAAAGISGKDVIGGDLDSDQPYFLVKDPE